MKVAVLWAAVLRKYIYPGCTWLEESLLSQNIVALRYRANELLPRFVLAAG